ncbi:TPA: hypothetical protein DF272_06180 [Candidatus Falkowbacteria bacterium]|nr:hypothetical protein [Candidatus Falkowbacteria bacterium]
MDKGKPLSFGGMELRELLLGGFYLWSGVPEPMEGVVVLNVFVRGDDLHLEMVDNDVRCPCEIPMDLVVRRFKTDPTIDVFCPAKRLVDPDPFGMSTALNVFVFSLSFTLSVSPMLLGLRFLIGATNKIRGYSQYGAEFLYRLKGQVSEDVFETVKQALRNYYREGPVLV